MQKEERCRPYDHVEKKITIEMFPLNYEVEDLGLSEHSVLH